MGHTTKWWHNFLLIFILGAGAASAQTFEDGYQSYVRNQFPVAELQFKGALKRARTDEDRAFILKFIGICQYMRGDKRGAGGSFQQSVGLDQNVQIDEEEVLDPSVVSYFNAIKSKVNAEPKKKVAAEPPPPPPQPKPRPPAPKAPAKKVAKAAPKKKSKSFVNDESNSDSDSEDDIEAERPEKPRKSPISFMHFLPFGVGQFYNGSPLLGTVFASAQVFSLYLVLDADKIIEEREGLNAVVANKPDLNDEQRSAFYAQNNAFIQDVQKDRSTALLGFGLAWTAGVVEAVLRRPDTKSRTSLNLTPTTFAGEQAYVLHWKLNF